MNADKWMADELKQITRSRDAAKVYSRISKQSQEMFDAFAKNPDASPIYMITPGFQDDLKALEGMKLSIAEQQRLSAMKMNREIYLNQDHALRIKLMKHQLMNIYPAWGNGKTPKAGQSPKDDLMRRVLDGYDYLVIIPKVTAAEFVH